MVPPHSDPGARWRCYHGIASLNYGLPLVVSNHARHDTRASGAAAPGHCGRGSASTSVACGNRSSVLRRSMDGSQPGHLRGGVGGSVSEGQRILHSRTPWRPHSPPGPTSLTAQHGGRLRPQASHSDLNRRGTSH
jgi:hypothetical protein